MGYDVRAQLVQGARTAISQLDLYHTIRVLIYDCVVWELFSDFSSQLMNVPLQS